MKMKCVGIGKTVGAYGLEQVQTYVQRIQRFMSFEWVELKDVKHNKNNRTTALQHEEELILKHVGDRDALILFDENGKQMDSKAFSQYVNKYNMTHGGTLVFCLGGAYGFSDSLRKRANGMVSLSPMTFPHQLARVVALEQLYRACTINNRHPYHH
jgi:23S rRNA (pseudouridine1915-N3)-methyltransferase